MKSKFFALSVAMLMVMGISQAQDYKTAIGLRLGYPTAVTGRLFLNDNSAVEGIVGLRSYTYYSYISITGLYQRFNEIGSVDGLCWFYGGGANVNLFSYKNTFVGDNSSSLGLGIAGIIGLDYKFQEIPLNLSLDWLPIFSLTGYGNGFSVDSYALSARYVIN